MRLKATHSTNAVRRHGATFTRRLSWAFWRRSRFAHSLVYRCLVCTRARTLVIVNARSLSAQTTSQVAFLGGILGIIPPIAGRRTTPSDVFSTLPPPIFFFFFSFLFSFFPRIFSSLSTSNRSDKVHRVSPGRE
ncbi:hypothetical protein FRC14_000497 [Serendipita sp. 396]|nr:hypothetical protein FRC14_000497 [Serendipita sp. 396]KAG8779331.1 hypothetical protein FRC15_010240 [Serendipita sp. 397]KAG8791493.1 hypothetical protein FRC16_000392 [Serendipita sp. 398]KAG8838533.1 hypothetical protein FRC18_004165 [Serendipita sp. 400]